MTQSSFACYQLPVASVSDLISRPVGALKPRFSPESNIESYTAFDCFDHPLRRSGRLLLKTAAAIELVGASGRPLTQPSRHDIGLVSDLAKGPIKAALSDLSPLRRLLPLGTGERQHATLTLVDDEQKTHCRVYLLFITAKKGRATALAVPQMLRGYAASYEALLQRIADLGGLPADDTVHQALFPRQPIYDAKPEIIISGDTSAFDAANRIIAAHLPVARANEHGIIADLDTEFLHDYRIQLRKIRSVLSLFRGIYADAQASDLKARFSAVMAPTGRLRDLDVYLLEKQAYYRLLPKNLHQGLDALYRILADLRQAEHARLASHLRSQPYQHDIKQLAALYAQPRRLAKGPNAGLAAHEYASRLIWKRYRKVCKIAAGLDDQTPDADIHALRIQCKKLRYLMELFGAIFPPADFRKLLKSLKGLQDNLGLFNDYSVQQVNLHAALQAFPQDQNSKPLEIAQSVGALIAVLHGRQLKERAKIVSSFTRFNSLDTQHIFSKLFHEGKASHP